MYHDHMVVLSPKKLSGIPKLVQFCHLLFERLKAPFHVPGFCVCTHGSISKKHSEGLQSMLSKASFSVYLLKFKKSLPSTKALLDLFSSLVFLRVSLCCLLLFHVTLVVSIEFHLTACNPLL